MGADNVQTVQKIVEEIRHSVQKQNDYLCRYRATNVGHTRPNADFT